MSKIATLNQIGSAAMTGKAYTDARLDALTLGALADANVPSNAANGSLLSKQNGEWTPTSLSNIAGGAPALVGGGLQSANIGKNGVSGLELCGALPDGTRYAASFVDSEYIALFKAEPGQGFTKTATFTADSDTGWITFESDYIQRAKYRKKNGVVFVDLNGTVSQPITSGVVIATLPEGFRPASYITFAIGSHGSQKLNGIAYINTSGAIIAEFSETLSTGWPDGSVSYPAA